MKLLFPDIRNPKDISKIEFKRYCLKPAMKMRKVIRMQMSYIDEKYQGAVVPDFKMKEFDEE